MAKTTITTSNRLTKDCFIGARENKIYQTSVEKYEKSAKDDRVTTVESKTDSVTSVTLNDVCRTFGNVEGIREWISGDNSALGRTEIVKNDKAEVKDRRDKTANDDKSDYGAESFYSDGSCQGSGVTDVTPRSSSSDCSSLLSAIKFKYEKRRANDLETQIGDRWKNEDDTELSLVGNEIKHINEEESTLMLNTRRLMHSGRKNMSFTNDELRKIERENQLLLKKIMSHQKPQSSKTMRPVSGPPRISSSAINRKRQQKKIQEDNMLLLRRIQQAKSRALPKNSLPGCRLTMI